MYIIHAIIKNAGGSMKNLSSLLKYLKPYKKWVFLAPLFLIFELIMDIFLPAIFGNVINIGVVENNMKYIIGCIILMTILTTLGLVGGIFSVFYGAKASEHAANDLRKDLFKKFTELSLFDLKKFETGHLLTTLTNDINLIANIIMISLRIFFRVPIIVIGSVIMAVIISPKLSLILLLVTPILAIITFVLTKIVFPKFLSIQDGIDEVNSKVREDINGIKTLKSLVKEDEEKQKFDTINIKLRNTNISANRFLNVQVPLTTLLVNICIILVLYYGGKSILDGTYEVYGISVGTILAFIQYLTNILYALVQASAVIVLLSKSEVSALRIKEILDMETIKQKKHGITFVNDIKLRKVEFNYGGKNVLTDINLDIKKGEIIGVAGLTGSGKSTLIGLISKSILPTKGKIFINDVNLNEIDIHKSVSIAYQEPILMSGSVRKNIKYSVSNATDAKMRRAAMLCEIDDFIMKQMGAYDFEIGAKGLNLSGGQRQRIALARAVLADADILILDDAISSVDAKTERKILENFHQGLKNKIIIMVSSKTRTLMNCDKVVVLDGGKVDAFDDPKTLLKENKIFKEMHLAGGDSHDE